MKRKVGRVWIECGPATPIGCGLLGETHTSSGYYSAPLFNLDAVPHKPSGNVEATDMPHWNTPPTIGFYEKLRRRDLTSGVE